MPTNSDPSYTAGAEQVVPAGPSAETMRLLLVEDDDRIAGPVMEGLNRYGFAVDHVKSGASALSASTADLILLDLGLPDMDGIDVCRALRARSTVPIIMITARGEETDRVVGLEVGADDYLSKPFGYASWSPGSEPSPAAPTPRDSPRCTPARQPDSPVSARNFRRIVASSTSAR